MTTHNIKCWPDVFGEMLAGRKTAEFRLNDRDYRIGDTLLIREWCPERKEYTHREITRLITHVLSGGFGMPKGYAMLSLASLNPSAVSALVEAADNLLLTFDSYGKERLPEYVRKEFAPLIKALTAIREPQHD